MLNFLSGPFFFFQVARTPFFAEPVPNTTFLSYTSNNSKEDFGGIKMAISSRFSVLRILGIL